MLAASVKKKWKKKIVKRKCAVGASQLAAHFKASHPGRDLEKCHEVYLKQQQIMIETKKRRNRIEGVIERERAKALLPKKRKQKEVLRTLSTDKKAKLFQNYAGKKKQNRAFNLQKDSKRGYAKDLGISQRTIRSWKNITVKKQETGAKQSKTKLKRTGFFPESEKKLFQAFTERRDKGLKVTGLWLRTKMKFIVQKNEESYDSGKHKFSQQWLKGFLNRFEISLQRRTNKKIKANGLVFIW